MLGEERARGILRQVVAASREGQVEAVLMANHSYVTRFTQNYIHQNVGERNDALSVRVAIGKRVGVAQSNRLTDESIVELVRRAETVARLQPENPEFVSLPGPEWSAAPASEQRAAAFARRSDLYDRATAEASPVDRAEKVREIVARCRLSGITGSGAVSTGVAELAVGNSLGIGAYTASTVASVSTVVMGEDSSGYADAMVGSLSRLDAGHVGAIAVEKCVKSREPVSIDPGEYEVILEEPAVADMLQFLGYLSFSALAVQEQRSFMMGEPGRKVMDENVTIWDDGLDPAGMPIPFDFEGVPKEKVVFIDHGRTGGVVHDSLTAAKVGRRSTGHALPAPNTYGPMPMNMFMAAGNATLEDMIRSVRRGLLVTRFHYTNPVHPIKVVLTGMTRDGTFLIEDGEIRRGVKNLRFTQSVVDCLDQVEMIGKHRSFKGGWFGGATVPAVKVSGFNFTGATEF